MAHPAAGVAKLAEASMKRWLEREKLDKKIAEQDIPPKLGPYVVISRQCGARGTEIAALLSDQLGWDLVDRKIVENIAADFDVSLQQIEFVDERHVAWLTEIFKAWMMRQSFCQGGYVQNLGKLLLIAAQHGKFVMVGRGSQFILPREFGIFVRFHAPFESRVANVSEAQQLSEEDAAALVTQTDNHRSEFLKSYFQSDGSPSHLYDLVVDTSRFSPAAVAELIRSAAESRRLL